MSNLPTLAYFSPLPPIRSGVSDYSAELLPHLARFFRVILFVSQPQVHIPGLESLEVLQIEEFEERHSRNPYDHVVYHIGNGLDHERIYHTALRFPGVIVLHDFVLHHFLAGITLDRGNFEAYVEELIHEYGEEGAQLAHQMIGPGVTAHDRYRMFMEHPLNRRILRSSLGAICHSNYVADLIRQRVPENLARRVPMGIFVPHDEHLDRRAAREELGLSQDEFIIASFGRVTSSKRIDKALFAFARLRQDRPDCRYLLVGEVEPDYPIREQVSQLGLESCVDFIGFTTLDEFHRYIQAADVCVNLRYPTAGETSAGLLRILAAGRPVLVSNTGAFMELPDDALLKVDVAPHGKEEELIYRFLTLLRDRPDVSEQLGNNARRFVLEERRLEDAARKYRDFLYEIKGHPIPTDAESKTNPSVYVVVLNYQGEKHIDVCLQSLLAQSYPNTHVINVDNASPDGSGAYARDKYPQVEHILLEKNLGFARGNNVGFERALAEGADYVVALNNDVEVDRDWVRRQVEVMESDPTIGGCGSRLLSYWQRDLINSLGHEMNQWGHTWDIGFGRRYDEAKWPGVFDVVSICGCSFMIRRNVLEKVKGFDPSYFAYYDDVDLSIRIRGEGYRLVTVPNAIVYHKFSASFGHESPRKLALCTANKWRFMFSHFPLKKIISVYPRQIKRDAREALRLYRLGEDRNMRVLKEALWNFTKMLPGLLWYRARKRWPKKHYEFLKLCAPTNLVPHFFAPRQDYELLREKDDRVPDRVIMGYSDEYLGEGWFPAESGYYTEVHRWMSKKAFLFLNAKKAGCPKPLILQMHLQCQYAFLNVPTLSVSVEGQRCCEAKIGMGWKTLQVRLPEGQPDVIRIDLECDRIFPAELTGEPRDVSLLFDEISLVSEDSPFLRAPLVSEEETKILSTVASSVAPSVLRAQIALDEKPRTPLSPGVVYEISVTVSNTGDTCWIAKPLSGGGHVTLAAQLLDVSGIVLNLDYGRQVLDRPIFPGETVELTLPLRTPDAPGDYQVKIDMVDEGICWFENAGSSPSFFAVQVKSRGN